MKVLVIGANGFIGSNAAKALSDHEVFQAGKGLQSGSHGFDLNLTDQENIEECLNWASPEIIIDCAGIVSNDESAKLNPLFTTNLLTQVAKLAGRPRRIIITGSAAEYGQVSPSDLPVPETAPVQPTSVYGQNKADETAIALKFRNEQQLPVIVIRIFNPIGAGMPPRLLLPSLIHQARECSKGTRSVIEVSRLDAMRDFVAVTDVALAIKFLVECNPKSDIYNIGSGVSTSISDLVDLIIGNSKLENRPEVVETSDKPEPPAASQADISRLIGEFGWRPVTTLSDVIKEILDEPN